MTLILALVLVVGVLIGWACEKLREFRRYEEEDALNDRDDQEEF